MKIFLDTSSLLKMYIEEDGSPQVRAVLATATEVIVSVLAEPEAISAWRRLVREQKLTENQYRKIKKELADDLPAFEIIELDRRVVDQATELMQAISLRAADAIHVASAALASTDYFVTADQLQFAAARTFGLKVLDPTNNTR